MATSSKADISETQHFFWIFIAFKKFTLNLEYFETKDQSQSLSITEIINCETDSYLSVQKGHLSCNASSDNMLTGNKHC